MRLADFLGNEYGPGDLMEAEMTTTQAAEVTEPAGLTAGQWLDGYQVQAQAPVDFIRGSRSRLIDGHSIRGSWSDPWWLYGPGLGWAVAKTWRNKDQVLLDWSGAGHRAERIPFAARAEIIVEPYETGRA